MPTAGPPDPLSLALAALAADPRNAVAYHNLGCALVQLRRYPEARTAFERALAIVPEFAEARNGLGVTYQMTGNLELATTLFRQAFAAKDAYGEAACNVATALLEAGDVDEAVVWYQRAVRIEPRNARFYRLLVACRPEPASAPAIRALESLLRDDANLAADQRIELHFALAKGYTDRRRYDEAFLHFDAGNARKRAALVYDEASELRFLDGLPATFNRAFLDAVAGAGNPSQRPIFIVGMPRSGTTLVEQVLAAHPGVAAGGELGVLDRAIRAMPLVDAAGTLEQFRAAVRALGDRYVRETDDLAHGASRLTDKMPQNFRFVPLIYSALPNARIIHVRRDPVDTCFSCYATLFHDPLPYAYDLGELGRYYRAYARVLDSWRALLPADRFLEVRYEEFVDDISAGAREIVAFCGLEWADACLDFHRVRRPVRTASQWQVRQPLYRSSIGRATHFGKHLGPLVEALRT
jgi:tetratricopeptide (TPR) repeat protein